MVSNIRLLNADVTSEIIGAFFEVYNELGSGLLETVYAAAVEDELGRRGRRVDREQWIATSYKGRVIARQRVDMIVDRCVIVEIKASELLPRFAERQLMSYLAATTFEVGLILHFGPEAKFHRLVSVNRTGSRE
jgi:GxxExxY protein